MRRNRRSLDPANRTFEYDLLRQVTLEFYHHHLDKVDIRKAKELKVDLMMRMDSLKNLDQLEPMKNLVHHDRDCKENRTAIAALGCKKSIHHSVVDFGCSKTFEWWFWVRSKERGFRSRLLCPSAVSEPLEAPISAPFPSMVVGPP